MPCILKKIHLFEYVEKNFSFTYVLIHNKIQVDMPRQKKNKMDIHLNFNVRGIPQSETLAINELSDKLKQEGIKVYKLGLGQSPFPVPKPIVEELKVNAHQKDYLPVKGLMALRDAVANYHNRNHCE